MLPPNLHRVVDIAEDDIRAGLFLGAARELTNRLAAPDTQNTPVENAEGHFLGALAEIGFAKLLDASSMKWVWSEPLRIEGGRATRGPAGGDFLLWVSSSKEPLSLEVKSLLLTKPGLNLNLRKLVHALAGGVAWVPVTLCPALRHAKVGASFTPLSVLAEAVKRRGRWTWHAGSFHPEEFGQSYLASSRVALAGPPLVCQDCSHEAGRAWLQRAPAAVERLRATDPSQWPSTGVEPLLGVTEFEQLVTWWQRCRQSALA